LKRKLVIVLSLFLMFLSVSYIAYFIASNTAGSENSNSKIVDNFPNSKSEGNDNPNNSDNSNTKSKKPDHTPEDETSEPTVSPTVTSKADFGTSEVEFVKKGIVNSAVFTHPQPETNSSISRTLKKDEPVNIVSETGGWYKLDDNTYVYSSFINVLD
jgi:hypothetical protein